VVSTFYTDSEITAVSSGFKSVVTKKRKPDDKYLYCGENDPFDNSSLDHRSVICLDTEVIKWSNAKNNSKFNPSFEGKPFGLT